MRKRQHSKRTRKGTLVTGYLENVTRKGLDRYREVVFDLLKDARGVYVLFGDRRPYFVGLIDTFAERLEVHLKDWKWDTASMYLTGEEFGIQDLETLLLRTAAPDGNRRNGNFLNAKDLKPEFRRHVAEAQKKELSSIIAEERPQGGPSEERGEARPKPKPQPQPKPEPEKEKKEATETAKHEEKPDGKGKKPKARRRPKGKKYVLAPYAKKGFEIRFWYKGRLVTATVEKDGSIRHGDKTFSSPSLAASEIMGRTANGWMVWKYERSPGEWVLLNELKQNK